MEQPRAVAAIAGAVAATPSATPGQVSGEVRCSVCTVPCSTNYYYRAEPSKKASTPTLTPVPGPISICPLCYADGRFPSDLSSVDFCHIDTVAFPSTTTALKAQPWSQQETLALLEAVEGSDDWDAIAAKVGRPRDQCVLAFLRLPTVETVEAGSSENTLPTFPYGNVENPVMSTVAFLASMVHPKVAAAASKAAMAELAANPDMDTSQDSLQHVAATAIAAASARAAVLAGEESARLARLRETLVDLQLQKIRSKLQLFEDLEKGLEADRKDVEQQRLQIFLDRFNLRKMMLKAEHAQMAQTAASGQQQPPGSNNLTKL